MFYCIFQNKSLEVSLAIQYLRLIMYPYSMQFSTLKLGIQIKCVAL